MICAACQEAGNQAGDIVSMGDSAPMGSLAAAMRGHRKCKGGTWCDCQHEAPKC